MAFVPNAATKFLFAILKQCDLKHIDWEEVSKDPHLEKPVTNGHAARMRYSRLRAVIQGPTKKAPRNTTAGTAEGRTAKPKKNRGANPPVPNAAPPLAAPPSEPASLVQTSSLSVSIKQDPDDGVELPASNVAASNFSGHRFLTPCSDDMSPQTPHLDFGSRMQTHDVGASLFCFDGDAEECDHPDQFKQDAEVAAVHCQQNSTFFMQGEIPWMLQGHSHSPMQSTYGSHKGSLDEGCFHTHEEAAQMQAFLNGGGAVMMPMLYDHHDHHQRIKSECD